MEGQYQPATSLYVFFSAALLPSSGIQNQGDGPGVVWKWQQVPVAAVSLGSLGMALGQAALRRQLPSMP